MTFLVLYWLCLVGLAGWLFKHVWEAIEAHGASEFWPMLLSGSLAAAYAFLLFSGAFPTARMGVRFFLVKVVLP